MKNKWTLKHFFYIFLTATLVVTGLYRVFFPIVVDYQKFLQASVPEAITYKNVSDDPAVYLAYNEVDLAGYVVFSRASGYQSMIVLMTAIDPDGVILKSKVVSENETPSFFKLLHESDYLQQFKEKRIANGVVIDKPTYTKELGIPKDATIDAVSGATISSIAVATAVTNGIKYLGRYHLGIEVFDPYNKIRFTWIVAALLLIFGFVLLSKYQKRIVRFRVWVLAYSTFVLGFYANTFITFNMLCMFFRAVRPPPNILWWHVLVIGTIALILVYRRNMFCYWMCPFGAMQELILKVGGFPPITLHPKLANIFRLIPAFLAWMAVMIALITGESKVLSYEPFGAFFNGAAESVMWMTLPVLVFVSLVQYRFYCRYFCPVGFVLSLIVKARKKGVQLWEKALEGKTL